MKTSLIILCLLQLVIIQHSLGNSSELLKVSLYYESLCPFCENFIINQLYPGYQVIGSSLTLELVPYGNTRRTNVDGHWIYRCQHGENECNLNRLQACGISKTTSESKQLDYVNCVETAAKENSKIIPKCGKTIEVAEEKILECFNGPEGLQLIEEYANKTESLNPAHTYVPWIIFNDQFNETILKAATEDFVGTACSLFKNKPQGCAQSKDLLYLTF